MSVFDIIKHNEGHHRPFRRIPLYCETEDQQLVRLEDDIEETRLRFAFKVARYAVSLISSGQLTNNPKDLEGFCRLEQVHESVIPAVVSLVSEQHIDIIEELVPDRKCAQNLLHGRI